MHGEQLSSRKMTRGVYFLSNNVMYDLTIAFLNSLRTYNPTIPLVLIPYDENTDQIEALQDTYQFDIFRPMALFNECDQMSRRWHDSVRGEYRKFAIWEGRFDEFIYIDIDTVVLDDLSFCFEVLQEYGCITATSNIPAIRKFVWLDGVEECGILDAEQIAYSANTGFIVSKKGFFNFEWVKQRLEHIEGIEKYMEFFCLEQPVLNYLIVTSGKPYTSLFALRLSGKNANVPNEYWGGSDIGEIKNGKMYSKNHGQIFLIHWAGVWRLKDQMPNKEIWDFYRNMQAPLCEPRNI